MRDVTLCLLSTDTQVCLGMKKRSFGERKWNGVGGKVHEGESEARFTSLPMGRQLLLMK